MQIYQLILNVRFQSGSRSSKKFQSLELKVSPDETFCFTA